MDKRTKDGLGSVRGWADVNHRGEYKTAITGEIPYTHKIVTRVNFLTAYLWLEHFKSKWGKNNIGEFELTKKPNWIIMYKRYRRECDLKLKSI